MSNLIKSLQHAHVKHLVKLRTNKRYRQEQKRIVISTEKIIREVARSARIYSVMVTEDHPDLPWETIHASGPVLKKASGLTATNDWVAEIEMPAPRDLRNSKRILILDRIADPGNAGTLIRTAHAMGWDGIYFLKGGVDPFNEKVVRASRGALFSLPYQIGDETELIDVVADRTVYVAAMEGKAVHSSMGTERMALILGNEAQGAQKKLARQFPAIAVPMPGEIDSLNVAIAGAILIYALTCEA